MNQLLINDYLKQLDLIRRASDSSRETAIAESEHAVGKKQFNRANFYTGKTVDFSPSGLKQLLRQQLH